MTRSRAALAALLAAACLAVAAPRASAEEIKTMQGMDFYLYGNEYQGNPDSPFSRATETKDWLFDPYTYSDYSLRFQGKGSSGQIVASVKGGASSFSGSVEQAWIKTSFGEGWGLAFGRRELKWKDGGYWNPSDVVNRRLAWNETGQAVGRDSIELLGLVPFMDFNLDLTAATVLESGLSSPSELPAYLTLGSILYPFELRAKAGFQSGRLPIVAGAARYSFPGGTAYVDCLWLHDRPLTADFGLGSATGSWLRYCAGAQWTADISESRLASSLSLRAEYLRQDDGLGSSQMSDYLGGLATMDLAGSGLAAYAAEAGKWDGRFFALGRDYIYASLALSEIANEHISLSSACILNADDLSFAIQNSITWSPLNLMSISLSATNFGGKPGGEALMIPYSAEYTLTLSRSF